MELDLSPLSSIGALLRATDAGNGLRRVAIDAVQPDPNQPRKTFNDESLAELAASIRSIGVIQPPTVKTQGDGYMLISGERRWRAARQLGWETIDVIVRDDLNARAQLVENIQREALSAWEVYRFISGELDAGASQADLAQALGKSRAWITAYAAIDLMPERLVTALREGRVTGPTDLGQLHRLLNEAPNIGEQLLRSSGQISRSMIEKARKGSSALRSAGTAVASASLKTSDRAASSEFPTQNLPVATCADMQRPSRDLALGSNSATHRQVRIRVEYENAYWIVDYLRQSESDGVVWVRLESDDERACFAPIKALSLKSIECI